MERQHGAARRRDHVRRQKREDGVVAWRRIRRGQVFERVFVARLVGPAVSLLQMAEGCATRDAKHPRAKHLRLLQQRQLPIDDQEDVLQQVFGIGRSDQSPDITLE